MTRARPTLALLTLGLLACGPEPAEEQGPVDPPVLSERPLPARGGPGDEEFEEPPLPEDTYDPDDQGPDPGAFLDCCVVRFALAPDVAEDGVDAVTLRGSFPPLDDGVALTDDGQGVWSAEACVPPDQLGTYAYDVASPSPSGGDPFVSRVHNPFAPTTEAAGQTVNFFFVETGCDEPELAAHGRTSE
jgi:hypothetical protein